MLKFLFGRRDTTTIEPIPETQRQVFERLIREVNEVLDMLPEKPAVTVHPGTGHISIAAPAQFPDEMPALPAPETTDEADRAENVADKPETEQPAQAEAEAEPEGDHTKTGV